jgi:cell shape-determining protein MreC
MEIEQIVSWIVAILPSVIAVLTTVGVVVEVIKKFKKLRDDVSNMTAMKEIREELKQVVQENYALKKKLNETMTLIDKVHRNE